MRPFYFLMSKLVHPHVLTSRDHLLTLMLFPGLLVSLHPRRVRPLKGSGRGCPLLRASSDHRFIVGALRARRAPGHFLSVLLRPRVVRARETSAHPSFVSRSLFFRRTPRYTPRYEYQKSWWEMGADVAGNRTQEL